MLNPMFWLMFPVMCVVLVFVLVGISRFARWLMFRHDWLKSVRTQRTAWEQEEIELLRGRTEEE